MPSDSFFDSDSKGAFSLNDLSLSLRNLPPAEGFGTIQTLGSEEERVSSWLAETAYFHEIRHYHDIVGSPSGIGLFLETTQLIDMLFLALRDNKNARIPINQHAPNSAPARLYRLHHSLLSALLGDETRMATPEQMESIKIEVMKYRFPELGLEFAVPLVPVPHFDLRSGEMVESHMPLGIRALMEHTATEIQLFIAAIAAGNDPFATEDFKDRGRRFFEMYSELVRGDRRAYYLLRQFAQYRLVSLDTRPVSESFPDTFPGLGSLMALTQAALDIGGYAIVDGQGWVYEHPGLGFCHLLAPWRNQWESWEADIDAVDKTTETLIGRGWRDFLAGYVRRMERQKESVIPSHLTPEAAAMPLIGAIRQTVLEHHLAIMRSKADDLRPWVDPVTYVKNLDKHPRPPLNLASRVNSGASPVQAAEFLVWSILLGTIEGVMNGDHLGCTIATRLKPAMELFEFADPVHPGRSTTCHQFVEQRHCGRFDGKFLPDQPRGCPFAKVIGLLQEGNNIQFHFGGRPHDHPNGITTAIGASIRRLFAKRSL